MISMIILFLFCVVILMFYIIWLRVETKRLIREVKEEIRKLDKRMSVDGSKRLIREVKEEIKRIDDRTTVDGSKYMEFTDKKGIHTLSMSLNSEDVLNWFIALSEYLNVKLEKSPASMRFKKIK